MASVPILSVSNSFIGIKVSISGNKDYGAR